MKALRVKGQEFGGVPRDYWRKRNAELDPEHDYEEIYRNVAQYEFPWEIIQSLSMAQFRPVAVPSIGELLARTGQFEHHGQQRYDDTSLLLEAPITHGFNTESGRTAIRRVNQMHHSYDISNDDLRYVLSTFVVIPVRWIGQFGKRPLDPGELIASVRFWQEFGKRLGVKGIPSDYQAFSDHMDSYEADNFKQSPGSRRVADATLDLLATFYPRPMAPIIRPAARSVMDQPLLNAFGYQRPPTVAVKAANALLRGRGQLMRIFPARRTPALAEHYDRMRSYPGGFALKNLGTFPTQSKHRMSDQSQPGHGDG
jgi:hypothetical protein